MKKALLCLGLVLAPASAQAQEPVIELGAVLPLTGPTAHFGTEALRGINLAIESINGAGGVKGATFKLIVRDNAGDPATTSKVTAELTAEEKVFAVVGPITSTNAAAAAAVAQQARTPILLPTATSPYVTEIGDYVCRICFTDPYQSKVLTEFCRKHLKADRVAVLYEKGSAYSEKLAEFFVMRFEDMGGTIVSQQSFVHGADNIPALVESAIENDPDVLFAPLYYREAAAVVNAVAQLGSSVTLLGGDGWESTELFRLTGDNITPGRVFISSHFSLQFQKERGSAFVKAFERTYGDSPNAVAALGYDAVMVVADAMRRATVPGRDGLRQALVSTSAFSGVTGTITINEKRNVIKDVYILKAVDGKFVHETALTVH
jgi:branched-chain amino acid transport system substrate-binding protein